MSNTDTMSYLFGAPTSVSAATIPKITPKHTTKNTKNTKKSKPYNGPLRKLPPRINVNFKKLDADAQTEGISAHVEYTARERECKIKFVSDLVEEKREAERREALRKQGVQERDFAYKGGVMGEEMKGSVESVKGEESVKGMIESERKSRRREIKMWWRELINSEKVAVGN